MYFVCLGCKPQAHNKRFHAAKTSFPRPQYSARRQEIRAARGALIRETIGDALHCPCRPNLYSLTLLLVRPADLRQGHGSGLVRCGSRSRHQGVHMYHSRGGEYDAEIQLTASSLSPRRVLGLAARSPRASCRPAASRTAAASASRHRLRRQRTQHMGWWMLVHAHRAVYRGKAWLWARIRASGGAPIECSAHRPRACVRVRRGFEPALSHRRGQRRAEKARMAAPVLPGPAARRRLASGPKSWIQGWWMWLQLAGGRGLRPSPW